jgi:hypothetical protein
LFSGLLFSGLFNFRQFAGVAHLEMKAQMADESRMDDGLISGGSYGRRLQSA